MVDFFLSSLFPFHPSSILLSVDCLSVCLSIFPSCLSPFSTSLCPAIYPSAVLFPSRLSLGFEWHVTLFFTPKANLFLCGWILSATGDFTHSNKGQSSILSCDRCDRLWPWMKALHTIICLLDHPFLLILVCPCLPLPSFLFSFLASFLASFLVLFYVVKQ